MLRPVIVTGSEGTGPMSTKPFPPAVPPAISPPAHPARLTAVLDAPLSRWLWLVKWLLAFPHYVVLFFLWVAFVGTNVVAFFAILLTGRYPQPLFDFGTGVLRWSWRVGYYAYGTLGTDRYPPFTLADVPDYPAHWDLAHPQKGFLLGDVQATWVTGGPIGLLTLCARVALAATGLYPRGLFDLVVGLNRWVLRVAACAALLTDVYPPFRLDQGGGEPEAAP